MQYYELMDGNGVRICMIASESDEMLETELLLLATSIGGIGGVAQIEKKAAYWKVIHARRSGKVRYLICKRKNEKP